MRVFIGLLGVICLATTVNGVTVNVECTTDACDADTGLECVKIYSFCEKKFCQCPTGKVFRAGTGRCESDDSLAKIGETCFDFTIVKNAQCDAITKKVTCNTDYTAKGNVLCGDANSKLIGEACSGSDKCYTYTADVLGSDDSSCSSKGICDCQIDELIVGTDCKERSVGDRCSSSSQCPFTLQCVEGKCGCLSPKKRFALDCFDSADYGTKAAGDTCANTNECGLGMTCLTCPTETVSQCVAGTDVSPVTSYPETNLPLITTKLPPAENCKDDDNGAFRPGKTSLAVYLGAVVIGLVVKFW